MLTRSINIYNDNLSIYKQEEWQQLPITICYYVQNIWKDHFSNSSRQNGTSNISIEFTVLPLVEPLFIWQKRAAEYPEKYLQRHFRCQNIIDRYIHFKIVEYFSNFIQHVIELLNIFQLCTTWIWICNKNFINIFAYIYIYISSSSFLHFDFFFRYFKKLKKIESNCFTYHISFGSLFALIFKKMNVWFLILKQSKINVYNVGNRAIFQLIRRVDYSIEKLHSLEKIIKLILVCNPGLVNEYSKIDGISNSPAEALIIFSWSVSLFTLNSYKHLIIYKKFRIRAYYNHVT